MICHNDRCGKEVEQPLELYDGSWACPYCKREMGGDFSAFSITEENEELYILSERSYYRWLTNMKLLRGKAAQKLIDRAVELCRESAQLGNPLAVLRLGFFYDKDYVEVNRSEAVRCRIAYAYYSAVCFSDAELKEESGVGSDAFTLRGGWNDDGTNKDYDGQKRLIPFGIKDISFLR